MSNDGSRPRVGAKTGVGSGGSRSSDGANPSTAAWGAEVVAPLPPSVTAASSELIEDIVEHLRNAGAVGEDWEIDRGTMDHLATLLSKHNEDVAAVVRTARRASGARPAIDPGDVVKLRNQVADARARTAAVRSQLSKAELEIAQATQRASAAEEKFRKADHRAAKAEARLKAAEDDPLILRWGDKEWSSPAPRAPSSPKPSRSRSRSHSPSPGKGVTASAGGTSSGAGLPDDWQALRDKAVKDAVDKERQYSKKQLEQMKQAHEAELRRHFSPGQADQAMVDKAVKDAVEKEKQVGRRRVEQANQANEARIQQLEEKFEAEKKSLQAQALRGGSVKMSMMGGGDDAQKDYLKERRAMEKDIKAAKDKLESVKKEQEEEIAALKELHACEIIQAKEDKAKELALEYSEKDKQMKSLQKASRLFEEERKALKDELEKERRAKQLLEKEQAAFDAMKGEFAKEREKVKQQLKEAAEKEATQKEAHQRELDAIKQEAQADKEKAAQQMADRNQKQLFWELQQACFGSWQDEVERAKSEKAKGAAKKELEDLKQQSLQSKQATAQRLAERNKKQYDDDLCRDTLVSWSKAIAGERLAKEAFKAKEREAEVMAERNNRFYAESLLGAVVCEWKKDIAESKMQKAQAANTRAHERELETLKQEALKDKQKAAEYMASNLQKKHNDELAKELLVEWGLVCKQASLDRQTKEAKAKHDRELAAIKKEAQQDKEAAARHMAEKNALERTHVLLKEVLVDWHKQSIYSSSEKRRSVHRQELEKVQQEKLEMIFRQNQRVAEALRHAYLMGVLRSCFTAWERSSTIEVAEGLVGELRQKLHDDRLRFALKLTADMGAGRDVAMLSLAVNGWHRVTIETNVWKAQESAQAKYSEELVALKENARTRGDAALDQMAKRFFAAHMEQVQRTCLAAWQIQMWKQNAQNRRQSGLDKVSHERRRMKELAATRLAQDILKRSGMQTQQLYFGQWCQLLIKERHHKMLVGFEAQKQLDLSKVEETISKQMLGVARRWADERHKSERVNRRQYFFDKWRLVAVIERRAQESHDQHKRHLDEYGQLEANSESTRVKLATRVAADMARQGELNLLGTVFADWRLHRVNSANTRELMQKEMYFQGRERQLEAEMRTFSHERLRRLAGKMWIDTQRGLLPAAFADWLQAVKDSRVEQLFEAEKALHAENAEQIRQNARSWRLGFGERLAVGNEHRSINIQARVCLSEWRQHTRNEALLRKMSDIDRQHFADAKLRKAKEDNFRLQAAREASWTFFKRENANKTMVIFVEWRNQAAESRRELLQEAQVNALRQEKLLLRLQASDKVFVASERLARQARVEQVGVLLGMVLDNWHFLVERIRSERERRGQLHAQAVIANRRATEDRLRMFNFGHKVVDHQVGRADFILKSFIWRAWSYDMSEAALEKAWQDREENLRQGHEEDIAVLVHTQAERVDIMSNQMLVNQGNYESQLTCLRAMLLWRTYTMRALTARNMQNVEYRQEDELALLVHVQVTERKKMKKISALRQVDWLTRESLQRALLIWHEAMGILQTERQATQTKIQARTVSQMIANRSREQVATNRQRIGEAITKKHIRLIHSTFFFLFREAVQRAKQSEDRQVQRSQHRQEMRELYHSMLAKLEKTTSRLNQEMERVSLQSFTQLIVTQWCIVSNTSRAKRLHNLALRDQRWEYEDKTQTLLEKERQRRIGFARAAALQLARRVDAERTGALFRTWRENQTRQRFSEMVSRFHGDILDLNQKHESQLDKVTKNSLFIRSVMADIIFDVHSQLSNVIVLQLVVAAWRRSYMVMPKVHKSMLRKILVDTAAASKDRVLAAVTIGIRDKLLRVQSKAWSHWIMAVAIEENIREQNLLKQDARDKVVDAIRDSRKLFEGKVETFTRWLQQELRCGAEGKAFTLWSTRLKNLKQEKHLEELQELEASKFSGLQGRLLQMRGMIVPIMSRISRRTVMQRYFDCFRTLHALGLQDASFKVRVDTFNDRYDRMREEMKRIAHRNTIHAANYVQEQQLRINERQQLAFTAMAWCETSRTMHERKEARTLVENLEQSLELRKTSLRRMEENMWTFSGMLSQSGFMFAGLKCLYAWKQLVASQNIERQQNVLSQEFDSRIIVVRKKINAEKDASMERAYLVFERSNAIACMQEAFFTWQRSKDEARVNREKAELELKAHREKDILLREHRAKVMNVQHTLQKRWQQANQCLEEMEDSCSLQRCMLIWASETKVARIAHESKRTVDDYEGILKEVEERCAAAEEARRNAEARLALPSTKGSVVAVGRSRKRAVPPLQAPQSPQALSVVGAGSQMANAQLAWVQPAGTAELKLALLASPAGPESPRIADPSSVVAGVASVILPEVQSQLEELENYEMTAPSVPTPQTREL